MWVLRDFALRLEDKQGNRISEQQYLEQSLTREVGMSPGVMAGNRIRMQLTSFFTERDCVGLPRPVTDEKGLAQLASGGGEIRDAFAKQLGSLKKKVFAPLTPKVMQGKTLNGAMLAAVVQSYVQSINDGGVPTVAH
eukprot:SAG11_NODE_6776_length_1251_cov_1.041667_1_plen_136_part_10